MNDMNSIYHRKNRNRLTALEIASQYAKALASRNEECLQRLRATTYTLDAVHLDGFGANPLTETEAKEMYSALFTGFPDSSFAVKRTIAATEVVVQEWTFTGTNTGRFDLWPYAHSANQKPGGKRVRLRGITIYDISRELIQRETIYMDSVTLAVELGESS